MFIVVATHVDPEEFYKTFHKTAVTIVYNIKIVVTNAACHESIKQMCLKECN